MLVAHRYAGKMMSSVKSKIPLILQFPGNTFRAYIQTVNCPVGNRKKGEVPVNVDVLMNSSDSSVSS